MWTIAYKEGGDMAAAFAPRHPLLAPDANRGYSFEQSTNGEVLLLN